MKTAETSSRSALRRLHVIAGKGGVGKSMLARALMWLSADQKRPMMAFDGDGSNASLFRFHQEAEVVDVDGDGLVARWYEERVIPALIDEGRHDVLLDLGAGAERLFRSWAARNDAPALLREAGAEIVVWHVLEPSLDSVSPLLDTIAALPEVSHSIVLNLGLARGVHAYDPESAFAPMLAEPEFREAIDGRTLCRLPPLLDASKFDQLDLAFSAALQPDSALTLFERARLRKWLSSVREQVKEWI